MQIFLSLLLNAVKHTSTGYICIKINNKENNRNYLELSITDTGCGIQEENIDKIFSLFSSISNVNQLNPQGIGLQLHVSQKLTERMNGSIEVHSSIGEGTTFILTFPIKLEGNIEFINPEFEDLFLGNGQNSISNKYHSSRILRPARADQNQLTNRMHIVDVESLNKSSSCNCPQCLIVDDDPTNIFIMSAFCKSSSINFDSAFNGLQAIEKVVNQNSKSCCNSYSLVLMDINMPEMDGDEATRILRKKMDSNEIRSCNIAAVTAAVILNEKHLQKILDCGFTEVISKPISKQKFDYIISKYLYN